MGESAVRTLDTAVPASIDHIALNNQVVGMRKTVKRTKVQLINKMVKRVRVLKNCTKGTEQAIAKKKRKAERMLKEIEVIKRLDPDKVSKYALATTTTFKDVENLPSASETKAMTRYSNHKLMQDVVRKFREKHADWKALAAYLLSKNTGRRYKKKATKEKVSATAAATNMKAGETLMQNFLQQKGAMKGNDLKPTNILRSKNKGKQIQKDSGDEFSISELKKSGESFEVSSPDPKIKAKLTENKRNECDPLDVISKVTTVHSSIPTVQRKHMVIQSFSLHDTPDDTLPVHAGSSNESDLGRNSEGEFMPEFLQKTSTKAGRVKHDAFFMGGDDDVDSGTESIDQAASEGEEDGSDLEDDDQLQKGKIAIRSTFVGSLTDDRREKMSSWAKKHTSVRRPVGGKVDAPYRKRYENLPSSYLKFMCVAHLSDS
ncbi:serum response factor-binding protein 1-like [Liolophura sinensis]|uniref:serum response factor-binding protein 1-like n=1 Tax=Liolophura sinensis TaxID=3198878 RepID=UPI003158EF02